MSCGGQADRMIHRILSYARPLFAKQTRPVSENDARLFRHISEDDVFLTSYPRSGNTWLRYLLMSYRYPECDLDMPTIRKTMPDLHRGIDADFFATPSPRVIKSHTLYCDEYPKILYLLRDGRDCYWSYYNRQKHGNEYHKSFERFFYEANAGHIWPSSWHDHVRSWVEQDGDSPLLIVRYEDLVSQPLVQLRNIVEFVGWAWDAPLAERAIQLASVESVWGGVQEVGKIGGVSGGAGAWRDVYSPKMLQDFNQVSGGLLRRFGYDT